MKKRKTPKPLAISKALELVYNHTKDEFFVDTAHDQILILNDNLTTEIIEELFNLGWSLDESEEHFYFYV